MSFPCRWKSTYEDFRKLADDEQMITLVRYHKIRWLSLSDCVKRLCKHLQSLHHFLLQVSEDRTYVKADRVRSGNLYKQLTDEEFMLYLYFLAERLPLMAQLNVSMQVPNQNVYNLHHQIDTFKKAFLTPVVECAEAPEPLDDYNIKNIDNITFPGKNFTDFMSECEEQAHLTDGKRRKVLKNCVQYTIDIFRACEKRFPDTDLYLQWVSQPHGAATDTE